MDGVEPELECAGITRVSNISMSVWYWNTDLCNPPTSEPSEVPDSSDTPTFLDTPSSDTPAVPDSSASGEEQNEDPTPIAVGIAIPIALIAIAVAVALILWRRRKSKGKQTQKSPLQSPTQFVRCSLLID